MGFWNNLTKLFVRSSEDQSTGTLTTRRSGGSNVIYLSTSADTALAIATVYRCVKIISDSVAGLRLRYLRKKDGRYQEDENSDFHYLLTVQPQPEMSIVDFWTMAVEQMLLDGNAYIFPRKMTVLGKQVITDLVLCHRGSVGHNVMDGSYNITDPWSGVYGTFKESEIIHLYLHSSDGRTGESVIRHAARTIAIANTGDSETLNRFATGGTIRGLVTNYTGVRGFGEYQDEQLEDTAETLDDRFRNGERILSLPGDVEFKPLSLSSTDMQFLESRKFTVRDICRFFGVHPSFVFDDTSNNYKSAGMANVAFLSNTLDPILKRIEAEFCRKLISPSLCCKRVFRYDRKGIYSLDLASLADYQKKTIESGIYTINDWRRMENQPTVDGGDTVYLSTNLAALGSEKLGTTTPKEPTTPPKGETQTDEGEEIEN